MITRVLVLLFAATVVVSAQASQPPAPGKREPSKNEQKLPSSENATPEVPNSPAPASLDGALAVGNQSTAKQTAAQPNEHSAERAPDTSVERWYQDWGTWSDIIVALCTIVMAVYTWRLWVVSDLQRRTLDATLQATIDIERAYIWVKFGCPGVSENGNTSIRVINTGNTPATVTDISMGAALYANIGAVPNTPDYASFKGVIKHGQGSRVFVVKDEFIAMPFVGKKSEFIAAQNDDALVLAMFGFVDYMDKFGVHHRTGFGRFFVAEKDVRENYASDEDFAKRLNLGFLPKAGYNYDRVRVKGEGDDWDE